MKAVIQRVTSASVTVDGNVVGKIGNGFLVLLGVTADDTEAHMRALADKIAKMRIFEDENERMNLSLLDFQNIDNPYSVLVISQFTLYANCRHGNRPDFLSAAKPDIAKPLYEKFVCYLKDEYKLSVECGIFGADMKVSLLNDGPVTILLDTNDLKV